MTAPYCICDPRIGPSVPASYMASLRAECQAHEELVPVYDADGLTLYRGDCLDVLPRLADNSVDIVVTDPPYNAGKDYGEKTNDRQSWPTWCAWFDTVLDEMLRVSKDGVLCFLSQTAYRQYVRLGKHEMAWSAVWIKPLSMAVCAAPFMPHWEPIAYWGPKRRRRGDGEGWGSDVLTANVEYGKDRFGHPTPKPIALMRLLVAKTTGTILDPFAGSLTTLAAAKSLGRKAIGIEIEERFIKAGLVRLSQEVLGFGDEHERRQAGADQVVLL